MPHANLKHVHFACELRTAGLSFNQIAKELNEKFGTNYSYMGVWHWQKKKEWKAYAEELVKIRREEGIVRFEGYLAQIAQATEDITTGALSQIKSLAIAQKKIAKILEKIPEHIEIETAQDLNMVLAAQERIAKAWLLSADILDRSEKLATFMAENTAIDIEFEAYENE